jgi:MinD-like ATPase involved in chromosome partitioning or flagellar assembly
VLPRVLVVAGSTAGAGTSVTAAILAASAAALGRTVRLVDAAGGAQAALLGLAGPLDGQPTPASTTLSAVASPPGDLAAALAAARAAHLVVVDAGSRLTTARAALDAAAGDAPAGPRNPAAGLLVVTGTEPAALAAAFALVKALAAGLPAPSVDVLVVGADLAAAEAAFAHLDHGARQFLARPLRLAAAVPADLSLAVALGAGMPVHDAAAGSPAATALQPLAERTPAPAAPGPLAGLAAPMRGSAPAPAFAR